MPGRIRTLKPEWLENEALGSCSDSAAKLSAALILLADDFGNGRGAPGYLAGQVWAYRDPVVARETLESALRELLEIGYVVFYRKGGQTYFHLPGWPRHQKVDKPSKTRALPSPEDDDFIQLELNYADTPGPSRDPRETLAVDPKGSDRIGSDPKGSGGCGGSSPTARTPKPLPPEAEMLADELRSHLVAEKPDHALANEATWRQKRPAWSKQMAALVRAGRDAAKASEIMAWVFGDQDGSDYRFRVDSPKALKAKWDRVETAMTCRRKKTAAKPERYFEVTGDEEYGDGEVAI